MISLIVNVDDPNQSGLLETFASVRKTEQTNFVISGEELTFFHRPVKPSTTATQPWEDDWLETDAFEFAIGLPGEDFVAYSDTYTSANPGVNGTITVNTVAVVAAFADTTDDALPFVFSIKRTRLSGEVAEYYQAHCTLKRSVINPGSAIPTPSASYYTKTESDARFAPLSSVVTTGTGLWYLSSGTPSVLTVGSGLTIVGSTISATGGGGSGTAYLYADQTFTGINNFGAATLDPSDATFSDIPTMRVADTAYIMAAGDTTGEGGYIRSGSGSLLLESTLGPTYDIGQGLFYGAVGGQIDFLTQSITGDWTYNGSVPRFFFEKTTSGRTGTTTFSILDSTDDLFWHGTQFMPNLIYTGTSLGLIDPTRGGAMLQLENNYAQNGGLVAAAGVNTSTGVFTYTPLATSAEPANFYPCTLNVVSGALPNGLAVSTAYWFFAVDTGANTFKLASSYANALAGTAVIPSTQGTGSFVAAMRVNEINWTMLTASGQQSRIFNLVGAASHYSYGTNFGLEMPMSLSVPSYFTQAEPTVTLQSSRGTTDYTTLELRGMNTGNGGSASRIRLQAAKNNSSLDLSSSFSLFTGIDDGFSVTGERSLRIRDDIDTATLSGMRLIMEPNGDVGIGTMTPSSKLEVAGTLTATAVDSATWTGATTLQDENANALLNFSATADAVNQITIVNGATGNAPVITSTGSDTNVGLVIGTAGTGNLELGSLGVIAMTGSVAQDVNGAASKPALQILGTPFAGTGTTSFPLVYINDADATASTTLNTAGTYFGVNGNGTQDLMNLLKDGASVFKVASNGAATATSLVCATDGGGNIGNSGSNRFANIYATNQLKSFGSIENGVFGYYGVGGCTQIQSNAQGVLLLLDFNTGSTFSRIQFGGTTTSFPAIKRNATAINIRLADDSADAPLTASNITASGTLSVTGTSTFTGLLTANGGATVAGGIGVGAAVASTTFAAIAAATTAKSAINLASGTAPTSPNNGDIWFDGTDLKMRIGGVTKTFTLI